MTGNKKIKVAIIGFGRIATKHLIAIKTHSDELELVAIVDTDLEKIKKITSQESINGYKDIDTLIQNENVDLAAICTPTGLHAKLTKELASHGVNVVTEKPLATNWKDGKKMVESCRNNKVKLYTVKQFRNNPLLLSIKEAINNQLFGKLYLVSCNVFWTRPQKYYDSEPWRGTAKDDGGAIMNQASHFVDILSWLMGPVDYVDSITETLGRDIEVEDSAVTNIKWKNGAIGAFSVTMLAFNQNLEGSLTILGEKGTVKLSGTLLNEVDHWEFKDSKNSFIKIENLQALSQKNFQRKISHISVYKNIINNLNSNVEFATNGEEALKSLEMIIGMYRSSKEGKRQYFPID